MTDSQEFQAMGQELDDSARRASEATTELLVLGACEATTELLLVPALARPRWSYSCLRL